MARLEVLLVVGLGAKAAEVLHEWFPPAWLLALGTMGSSVVRERSKDGGGGWEMEEGADDWGFYSG